MHRLPAASLLLLAACHRYEPPPPPEPRDATLVEASLGRTWEAVIDLLAARNIPIRDIDRPSGLIATEALGVDSADGLRWADCGRRGQRRFPATDALYNVLVRGDSTRSSIRATVRWSHVSDERRVPDCTSTLVWERGLERQVQERAEERELLADRGILPPAPVPAPRDTQPHQGSSPAPRAAPVPRSTPVMRPWRTNQELLAYVSFRRSITDLQRLEIVTTYREMRPDTLTLDLGEGAYTSASTEYNLGRLHLAYRETTSHSAGTALELYREGMRVGLYSRDGLGWDRLR